MQPWVQGSSDQRTPALAVTTRKVEPMTPPEPSPPVLSWQPEEADYVEAFQARGMSRRTRARIGTLIALMVAVALMGLLLAEPFLMAAGIGWALAGVYAAGPGRRRNIRLFWRRSPALHGHRDVRLVPGEGMTAVSPGFTGHYAWSMFDAVLETDRLFILQLAGRGGNAFQVLAKRGLSSETDVSRLRELLTHEITAAAADAVAAL